ncbi:ROK family transcriptional regulator [Aquibium oceanicum]|uniref:Sugar kinase n=1 Tax=Aquibium oceanicum TaxID=1670800 RepID=A0A1L3SXE7_9HYPH|nr:ROK family transcriptional regulator [Aquibium oceanicum]APH74050.1 sugar kinase [Aquibium oceanicum]
MTAVTRSDDVRRQNRRVVIGTLRNGGRLSRTDICAQTGLSASTVSAITADLIEEDILREIRDGEAATLRRGRPQVALGLNPDAATVVAVVLSMNSLSAALIDYAGEIVDARQMRLETLRLSKGELVDAASTVIGELVARSNKSGRRVRRIAFGVQGITDSGARKLLWSPITPHTDIAFADLLEDAFGIPVTVENDCNMIALALRTRRPERYSENFIAILLSHGIGMGLMLNGQLFTGTTSSGAEFGHMNHVPDGALCRCGRRGCVEAYAGNYAIWRNARGLNEEDAYATDIGDEEMLALAGAARDHPGAEREAFRRAGEAIGFGLGSLFALIDPAPVAIVGQGALAFDLVEGPMIEALSKTAGGQHHALPTFETEPDEMPLIREGCALRALAFIDREIFAAGAAGLSSRTGKEIA